VTDATGTHYISSFDRDPDRRDENLIQAASARAAIFSLEVLTKTFDEMLRVIDDIALTTQVARSATFHYWRALEPPARNALCPCRSGLKAKSCCHSWAQPGPHISTNPLEQRILPN